MCFVLIENQEGADFLGLTIEKNFCVDGVLYILLELYMWYCKCNIKV